jgi:hypothetical protein
MKTLAFLGMQLVTVIVLAAIVQLSAMVYFLVESIAALNAALH